MRRFASAIIAALCFVTGQARAQSPSTIQPTTLIEGRKGVGPGEYTIDPERIPIYGPIIDDQEHIYILATHNNCLQHYDSNGKYLGCISIPSSTPATAEQRKNGEAGMVTSVFAVDLISGVFYGLQVLYMNNRHLLRRQGDSFVIADGDKDAADILKILVTNQTRELKRQERQFADALTQLGVKETEFRATHPLEKQRHLEMHLDKDKNIWVHSFDGLHVYSPAGALVYKDDEPGIVSRKFSNRGNLYIMTYYSHKSMTRASWSDDYIDGIRVTKYSLQGK